MVSEFEQKIYNDHLRISRVSRNKPYKLRQDFSKISPSDQLYLKRLADLFSKHRELRSYDFFRAPYHLYSDNYFDLRFFTTPRAILAWKLYIKRLDESDPDSPEMSEWISQGVSSIHKYCYENFIKIEEYSRHIDPSSGINISIKHLKDREVPIYLLLMIPEMDDVFLSLDETTKNGLFSSEFKPTIEMYRNKLENSQIKNKIKL